MSDSEQKNTDPINREIDRIGGQVPARNTVSTLPGLELMKQLN
ncbi:hypothetical protein KOR42_48090 [Thalassoglobus neptunius]|uniref:Uncharacterized protein n=1 Tax=Thalassoglobus neptunius TaxID=1938619 RepID=A0A5C5VS46_9PLAN|nr:hypothetical protein KOR42_48090 [Thalassoglobus neptunius]